MMFRDDFAKFEMSLSLEIYLLNLFWSPSEFAAIRHYLCVLCEKLGCRTGGGPLVVFVYSF